MKKTMIATVLGLALMPLTFAAQSPAKPATDNKSTSTDTSKPAAKTHKKTHKKVNKGTAATPAAPAAAPAK